MTPPVPRWEWRTFDGDLCPAMAALSSLKTIDRQTSDEIYLLSPHSAASVKIRGGRLDAKQLQQRNDSGLELWRPVLSVPFPLPAATVVQVLEILRTPAPVLSRAAYSAQEFLDEIVVQEPGLRAVNVHKTRTHFRLGPCRAEIAQIAANGCSVPTICLESEDPQVVIAAVTELGLGGLPNESYPSFLKALIETTGART